MVMEQKSAIWQAEILTEIIASDPGNKMTKKALWELGGSLKQIEKIESAIKSVNINQGSPATLKAVKRAIGDTKSSVETTKQYLEKVVNLLSSINKKGDKA